MQGKKELLAIDVGSVIAAVNFNWPLDWPLLQMVSPDIGSKEAKNE